MAFPPVRSSLKTTTVQDFNSLYIMFYYIIRTTYPKIGDLFCPVHIPGLSHSVFRNRDVYNKAGTMFWMLYIHICTL